MRRWYAKRNPQDAPQGLSLSEARAWVAGYAAAVRAYDEAFAAALAVERGLRVGPCPCECNSGGFCGGCGHGGCGGRR